MHALFLVLIGILSIPKTTEAMQLTALDLNYYVGLDAQIRYMNFKQGYGDNLLRRNSPQGNAYFGIKFNDSIGAEGGYETTITKSKMSTLTTGDILGGIPVDRQISPIMFRSKIKMKGPHLNLIGFYNFHEDIPLQLFASGGVILLKATAERKTVGVVNRPRSFARTLSVRKATLRLTGGCQYSVSEHLGFRGTLEWLNTSRMSISADDNLRGRYSPLIKPKNTIAYGIGVLWNF